VTGQAYRDAGVDIEAGTEAVRRMKAAVEATHGPRVLGGLGSFGGMYDVSFLKQYDAPILVSSTDGVGTKTRVASAMGRYDTIGQCLVNHCVNDILVQGAEPLLFLDYIASSRLDPAQVATVVGGCAAACSAVGCALVGGETAEMPGVYVDGELDVAGTIVGVVERAQLIDGRRIEEDDRVIGLASSGLHTNGYSLARKVLADLDWREPRDDLGGRSIGEELLAVHRPYLEHVRLLRRAGVDLRGLVHVTGGGLVDNPPRVLHGDLAFELELGSWPFLPIFRLIQRMGDISMEEMLKVFNCGLGMLLVMPRADHAQELIADLGETGWRVGRIGRRGDGPAVRFV
jgi:phosphoribosylformylglycinamidine cyclo-ligase